MKPNHVPDLDTAACNLIRETYRKVGINPVTAPEEEFLVGKAVYARGVRANDMTEKPYYS